MIGKNREKKKKRRYALLRWGLLLVLLLLILALLFGGRFGLGDGDLIRLVHQIEPVEREDADQDLPQPEADVSDYDEIRIIISGNNIQVQGEAYSLAELEVYLQELDEAVLVILHDQEAAYALFTSVEEKLEEENIRYIIEE